MRVRLNLATSPFENNRRFLLGAGGVGLVGVLTLVSLSVSTLGALRDSRELRAEISKYNSGIREFKRQRRDLEEFFSDPATKKSLDRAGFFNALIDQRSFPWTQVFTVLERLLPAGVRIASISPRMENGRVEVLFLVGALSDEAKIEFLKKLEESREFTAIKVIAETHPNRADQPDKVVVELVAWYHAREAPAETKQPEKSGGK